MSELPSEEEFRLHLGSVFKVQVDSQKTVELKLIEVTGLRSKAGSTGDSAGRDPFSVLFSGPPEILLSQKIYRMEHERLGSLELFIVPVGSDSEGYQYEAVFN